MRALAYHHDRYVEDSQIFFDKINIPIEIYVILKAIFLRSFDIDA